MSYNGLVGPVPDLSPLARTLESLCVNNNAFDGDLAFVAGLLSVSPRAGGGGGTKLARCLLQHNNFAGDVQGRKRLLSRSFPTRFC